MNSTEQIKRVHEPGNCIDYYYGLEVNCDGIATWREDPYALEIHEESIFDWICPGVYRGKCMDI